MTPLIGIAALLAVALAPPRCAAKVANYPLPSYVEKACHMKDPNHNACIVEVGNKVIPKIQNGDPKYRLPKLDPFVIPEIRINQGTKQVGINLVCKNCIVTGIRNAKFLKANAQYDKKRGEWTFQIDSLILSGKYNISGKVLLLPITGNGDMKINIKNLEFTFKYSWDLKKKSNGLEYLKVRDDFTIDHKVGGLEMNFENLFNGDKLLGDNMNQFLNENWKELVKELGPALANALGQILVTVLNNISDLIPYRTMFPE